jgi:hypothetical protein
MFQPLKAKVDPPNYQFNVSTLEDFYPEKLLSDLEKKYGKADVIEDKGGIQTLRFFVSDLRFKFPVIVQSREGKVLDSFSRLPNYFLHDVFLQSLVNRIGKQDLFKKVDEEAVYIWTNKDKLKFIYSAACTITCFPIFFTVHPVTLSFTPQIEKMKKSLK